MLVSLVSLLTGLVATALPLQDARRLPSILEYVPEDAVVCAWSTVDLPTLGEELGDGLIGRVWSAPEMALFRSELDLWTLDETPQMRELFETLTRAEGPLAAFVSPRPSGALLGFLVDPGSASLWPTTRALLRDRGFSIQSDEREGGSLHVLGSEAGPAALVLDADGAFGILRLEGDVDAALLVEAGERLLDGGRRGAQRYANWSETLGKTPVLLEGTALLRLHVDVTRLLAEARASTPREDREARELIDRVLAATGLDRTRWIEAAFASGGPTAPLRLAVAMEAPEESLPWRVTRQLGEVPQELFSLTPTARLQEVSAFSVRPTAILDELRDIAQSAGLADGLEAGLAFFEEWSALHLTDDVLPLLDGRVLLFAARSGEAQAPPENALENLVDGALLQDSLRPATTVVLGSTNPADLAEVVGEILAALGQEGATDHSVLEGHDVRRADLPFGSISWTTLTDAVVLSTALPTLRGVLAAENGVEAGALPHVEVLRRVLAEHPRTAYLSFVDGSEQLRTVFALAAFTEEMQPALWPLRSLPDPSFLDRFSSAPQITRVWHAQDVLWLSVD